MNAFQLELFTRRDLVPVNLHGVEVRGFRIVTASDMAAAESAVTLARVTGSVGAESYEHECAPPHVMPENRPIVRWAIVERVK